MQLIPSEWEWSHIDKNDLVYSSLIFHPSDWTRPSNDKTSCNKRFFLILQLAIESTTLKLLNHHRLAKIQMQTKIVRVC